jgi:hypothetical protein
MEKMEWLHMAQKSAQQITNAALTTASLNEKHCRPDFA